MKRIILSIFCFVAMICNVFANTSQYNPPTNLSVSELYQTEAKLSWNGSQNAVGWIVNYKVLQAEESTEITLADTAVELQSLVSGLRYIWKVRMIDDDGDTTDWSQIATFVPLGSESDCEPVEQLLLDNMSSSGLSVQWDPALGQTSWEVVCGQVGSNPAFDGVRFITPNLNHSFSGLTSAQTYQIAVRGICNGSVSDWKFINIKYVETDYLWDLPIQTTFETEEENAKIGFISGTSNPWVIGTAENATNMGTQSLYVSSDEGLSTAYIADTTISYAFMDFYVPETASSYYIDFKWKSNTNNANDKLKIYMLTDNSQLSINQPPANDYVIGQAQYTGNHTEWQSEHLEMPADLFGYTKRVVFAWTSTLASSMAVALDDIYITGRYCPAPHDLQHSNITNDSATLNWQSNQDQTLFNLQYKQINDIQWQTINGITPNYILGNLDDNTTYLYRIQADCQTEQSFWSVIDTFTTDIIIYPPTGLRLTNLIDTAATVQWVEGNGADRWIFEYKAIAGSYITEELFNAEKTLDNLVPNTSYIVRIRALTPNNDTSGYSNELIFQTYCTIIDNFPVVDLIDTTRCSVDGYCDVEQCWRSNADTLFSPYYDFLPLASPKMSFQYKSTAPCKVLIYTEGNGYSLLENLPASADLITKTYSLITYENEPVVRFAFINPSYSSDLNYGFEVLNFTIEDVCVSPQQLNIVSLNRHNVVADWDVFANNIEWEVVLKNLTNGDSIRQITDVHPWSYNGLTENNEYLLKVRSICSAGDSADNYTELSFTAIDDICMPPANFHCEFYSDGSEHNIICSWDSVGDILRWELEYWSEYAMDPTYDTQWLSSEHIIRDVFVNETYKVRIRTICSADRAPSEWSSWSYLTTNALSAAAYEQRSFEVYPNPTQGVINIKTDLPELKQGQLINSQGVVLRTWESLPMQIDVSNLSAGVYFIKVMINDIPVSKRFTIKK
ncbi:MAG: fibronectin type III domain-containing protein [Bacteroidales bacterium]|jgi:hypothetical protein|nr:fibronectin type III domain-containing protein [Bacteroidales bacterium]